jgi:imidazolonepropionase-like amidohydrolase
MLLFKNANFIPELTENGLKHGDLLVDGAIILQIAGNVEAHNCETVDLMGRYLVPGFIDLHIHLNMSGNDVLYDNFKNNHFMTLESYAFALDTLKAGFTTVRDLGSNDRSVNYIRDAIEKGILPGPRIISCGKILTPTESGNDYFEKMYSECDSADEVAKAARVEMKYGADFIKMMGSGAIMNPGGEPGSPICTDEEIRTAVNTAKIKNKYVAIHAHSAEAINQAIKCKVRTIEHASLIDDEAIKKLHNNEETYIVPTLTAFAELVAHDNKGANIFREKAVTYCKIFKERMKKAYDSGVVMGFGTDQGVNNAFHGKNGNEFVYRKEWFHMSNIDILKQATINSAMIAMIDDKVGEIKTGKYADLVVLDGNPLDDISICKNSISFVVNSGKIVNGDE